MQNVIDKIEWMFAGLGGFLGWFFGGFDGFLYALVVFVKILLPRQNLNSPIM